MAFDPDAFLKKYSPDAESNPFDPDAFLKKYSPAEPAPVAAAPAPPPPSEAVPFLRQVADVPLKLGAGAVTGVRMIADAFGADSSIGKNLRGVEDYIAGLYSAQSKKDSQEISRIMKDAEDKGVLDQVIAGAKAFSVAPVDMLANALGTAAPAIAAGLATTLGGAPALVATGARLGVGAMMGAGTTKGAIYDATKDALKENTNLSDKEIEARAVTAQEYGGKNLDQILMGIGLGAVGSTTAVEPMLARQLARGIASKESVKAAIKESSKKETAVAAERGMIKQGAVTGAKELATEFPQGAQEQLAQNIALQREGFDVPTMRGVVSQGALEGLAGLGLGAVTGAREASSARRELASESKVTGAPEDIKLSGTSAGDDIKTPKAPLGADALALLNPATDASGKALTTVSADTAEVQTRVNEEAAQVQLTKDQVIQKAQDYVAKVDAGEKPDKKLIGALAKELGVTLPFAVKSNVAKLDLIKQHLAQGAPSAATTGINANAAGASANVAALATADDPSAGVVPSGMVPPATIAQPAPVGKAVQPAALKTKTAADTAKDELNSLFDDDTSSLSARRTDAEIARDQKLDTIGKGFGLSRSADETAQQFRARISEAIDFEKLREDQPLSEIPTTELAKQTLREATPYIPPELQIDAYEEARKIYNDKLEAGNDPLPAYKELSDEDRRIYFQEGLPRPGAGTTAQHMKAARQLADFRAGVKDETFTGETKSRNSYNTERSDFGRKTGLSYSFPAWTSLSDESKKLFNLINKTDSAINLDMAFRAVKGQIQKEKTEQASQEYLQQAEADAKRQMLAAAERARKSQPAGKGDILPNSVLEALLAGDIAAVLKHIKESGNGAKLKDGYSLVPVMGADGKYVLRRGAVKIRDSISMGVFRSLAARLLDVEGLKVNVVFDENMVYDQIARYDAKTNTMFVGPNGLDEATVLHELLHAATVKIIHQFYTDASKLSPHARKAVEQLIKVAALAKKRLGSNPRYAPAFENLYEFVAYSQTDMDFQAALAQEQVGKLATVTDKDVEQTELAQERESKGGVKMYDALTDTIWSAYTGAIAYLYKLFTPGAKDTRILTLVPTRTGENIKNQVQNPGAGLTGKAREAAIVAFNKKLRAEKTRADERKGDERKAFEAKVRKAIDEVESEKAGLTESEKFDRAITRLNKERKLTANEKAAFDIDALFESEQDMNEANIPNIDTAEYATERGITNLKREILREPGYKGNLLLEAAEMISLIMAAPEGGIAQLAGKEGLGAELYATAAPATAAPAAAGKPAVKLRDGDLDQDNPGYDLKEKEMPTGVKKLQKFLTTHAGHKKLASIFQNDRYFIKAWETARDMSKQIYREGKDKLNNIYEQIVLATGDARNFYNVYVREASEAMDYAVGDFARKSSLTTEKALNKLHMVVEALHSPERRLVKYLMTVPLSDAKVLNGGTISPADRRAQIKTALDTLNLSKAQAEQLRSELNNIVFSDVAKQTPSKYVDAYGKSPRAFSPINSASPNAAKDAALRIDPNSDEYNATGLTLDAIKRITEQYNKHPQKAEIDRVIAALRTLHAATTDLNKIANYWSQPVSNRVAFYGFENYVPLKGNPNHTAVDEEFDFDSAKNGREAQDSEGSMDGRVSESLNPILQTMSDATRAAMRAGRRNVTQAIKNAIEQKILVGRIAETIKFEDRDSVELKAYKGETTIFHYNEDGSIDILIVADENLRNAIRRTYKQTKPVVDIANKLTSTVGQFHTRYNYQFAPLNFVRDALTNAFTIGAELGPAEAARFLKEIAVMVIAKNGLYKAMQVATLYERGDAKSQAELQALANKDPYIKDMVEYIKTGGMVSYLQGMSLKSNFQSLKKEVGRSNVLRTKEQLEGFVDIWTDMFELASRSAAYKIVKQNAIGKGESERSATVRAAAYVKNLANFEQVGEFGKQMGAFYMFFRPAATGAVRAIEAVAPAFTPLEVALERLSPDITGEAREAYKQAYAQKQQSARIMTASLIGLGMMAYAMAQMGADDDDLGRNTVATDNMQQWTRFARFHIPKKLSTAMGMGEDVIFQVPWGFGLGAFAAAGAQIAATAAGAQSFKDMAQNIFLQISLDSFVPIPVSRMPPLEMPLEFVLDSIAPSLARPILEFALNKNGLGQDIYNDQNRRFGDAYTGGDKIPEMYKEASRYMVDATRGEIDISPNTLYFLSNSYMDGIGRVMEGLHGVNDLAKGQKQFNPKTDVPLFGSFFGSKSNVDSREFSKVEEKVQKMEGKIKMFDTNPEMAANYDAKYPLNRMIVDYYNGQVNNELKELRSQAKQIRLQQGYTPKERSEILKVITYQQNLVKYQMLEMFKAYGVEP
jgi:hypothetical protein